MCIWENSTVKFRFYWLVSQQQKLRKIKIFNKIKNFFTVVQQWQSMKSRLHCPFLFIICNFYFRSFFGIHITYFSVLYSRNQYNSYRKSLYWCKVYFLYFLFCNFFSAIQNSFWWNIFQMGKQSKNRKALKVIIFNCI